MSVVRPRPRRISLQALVAVGLLLLAGGMLGLAVSADQHDGNTSTADENVTVQFPAETDRYPGGDGAGLQIAVDATPLDDQIDGDADGLVTESLTVEAPWLDFSACGAENKSTYGVDIGTNNSEGAIDHDWTSAIDHWDYGSDMTLHHWFGEVQPHALVEPDDEIVVEFASGGCLSVTDDPGWYALEVSLDGSEGEWDAHDEMPDEYGDDVDVTLESNYVAVCECDDEAEARDQLGPPAGDTTPTPASSPTVTPTPETTPTTTPTETPVVADDDEPKSEDDDETSPVDADGTGLGVLLALGAFSLATTIATRRQ